MINLVEACFKKVLAKPDAKLERLWEEAWKKDVKEWESSIFLTVDMLPVWQFVKCTLRLFKVLRRLVEMQRGAYETGLYVSGQF